MNAIDDVVHFLERQRTRQATLLPQFGASKVLSVMATSASPGLPPEVAVRRVAGLAPGERPAEVELRLHGRLPRVPERGECIAATFATWGAFRGFQLKSHTLVDPALASALFRVDGDGTRVHAPQAYTVHHTPHTANYFERVPFDEVAAVAREARWALVAVGEAANLSPRWILHHEVVGGELSLFQGDAMWSKTYLNVRRNPREARLVLDPETGAGFQIEGDVEEFEPNEHRVAAGRIRAVFHAAGLAPPTRLCRLRAQRVTRLAPAAA